MAEVRKKVIEDQYDTESIKKSIKSKEKSKKVNTINSSKNEKKKTKETKKSFFSGVRSFFAGVSTEFKRVHWTSKESLVKYSIATIFFVLFFGVFFYLIDVLFALVQSLF